MHTNLLSNNNKYNAPVVHKCKNKFCKNSKAAAPGASPKLSFVQQAHFFMFISGKLIHLQSNICLQQTQRYLCFDWGPTLWQCMLTNSCQDYFLEWVIEHDSIARMRKRVHVLAYLKRSTNSPGCDQQARSVGVAACLGMGCLRTWREILGRWLRHEVINEFQSKQQHQD